jgi:hypothetical protein
MKGASAPRDEIGLVAFLESEKACQFVTVGNSDHSKSDIISLDWVKF